MTKKQVKAFHAVAGNAGAVRRLLDGGFLFPATDRVDPAIAGKICQNRIDELTKPDSEADPRAANVVLALISERLHEITAAPPYSEMTKFDCEDLLAGDFKNVFCSIGGWHGAIDEETEDVSGFSFKAADLIRAGGVIRQSDLLDAYWQVLADFLYYEPKGRKTMAALKSAFMDVRRKNEISGTAALSVLRKERWDGLQEIVFPGPLPLELAVSAFESGREFSLTR